MAISEKEEGMDWGKENTNSLGWQLIGKALK